MSATIDREQVLAYAAEHGAQAAADHFSVSAGTVRSWRARERKVVDHRAREGDPGDGPGLAMVDVAISDEHAAPDPASGREGHVAAQARLLLEAEPAPTSLAEIDARNRRPPNLRVVEQPSELPLRHLGLPGHLAARLSVGDMVVAREHGEVWEVVRTGLGWADRPRAHDAYGPLNAEDPAEAGWVRLLVRPARADRGDVCLSADRSRMEPVDLEAARAKVEEDTRRRLADWNAQPAMPGEREARARQADIDAAHPPT